MIINALVGGTPGKDCGGFCKFCYFRTVDFKYLDSSSIGCKYCAPDQVGCSNCQGFIDDLINGFIPAPQVLSKLLNTLRWHELLGTLKYSDLQIITASAADIVFYPQLMELVSNLKDWDLNVHLGYTSGKGINDEKMADEIISAGVDGINFSVISTDPQIRRNWMGDKTPEKSLNALQKFCENLEVIATTVVIPDVVTEEDIFRTCSMLEDWGAKTFMLSRFVNNNNQGLILNNRPVIDGIEPQPFEEFKELVREVSDEFSIRVVGSPAIDTEKDIPYALSKRENRKYLKELPEVSANATVITSKLSHKPLKKIFEIIAGDKVNVIGVDKEIGDLITHEDLSSVNLDEVQRKVIIPGGSFVHEKVANEIFNSDGKPRLVERGPTYLFNIDSEKLSKEEVIKFELKSFKGLINKINSNNCFTTSKLS